MIFIVMGRILCPTPKRINAFATVPVKATVEAETPHAATIFAKDHFPRGWVTLDNSNLPEGRLEIIGINREK